VNDSLEPGRHRPWCTDHLDGNDDGWSDAEWDSCVTSIFLFEDEAGVASVGVFADQTPDQPEPAGHIDVSLAGLTPAQARHAHAALGERLDRIATNPQRPWIGGDRS
jgi:hypothetical protein